MLKYKEPFVSGLYGRHQMISSFISTMVIDVEIGYFMMQKPDDKKILYQNSLGDYRETVESNIVLITDKDVIQNLEYQITARYDLLEKDIQKHKEQVQIKIDELIERKGMHLQQLNDLARKNVGAGLSDNQKKSCKELKKAIKKITKKLNTHEWEVDRLDRKLELFDTGKFTSIENMKRLIKSIKG